MNDLYISKRLEAICSYVDSSAKTLDVGTDHAYVLLYLLKLGVISYAWACDVNPGPLRTAAENASKYGLSDKITLYLSDGLDECHCEENGYDHIIVAGMGGELIYEIIKRSAFVHSSGVKLILQPMTMQAYLRRALSDEGFEIIEESVVEEERKYYSVIVCRFTGEITRLSDFEIAFGKGIAEKTANGDLTALNYLKNQKEILLRIVEGKKRGNTDANKEIGLIKEIDRTINGVS